MSPSAGGRAAYFQPPADRPDAPPDLARLRLRRMKAWLKLAREALEEAGRRAGQRK